MNGKWIVENIPDLTGKVIIVTGGNSGIGFESLKEFARKGARVVMASRNQEKAEAALEEALEEIPDAKIEFIHLDLASLNSIKNFAEAFRSKYDRLDILLNNAGIMMVPYGLTEDDFEKQLGINHLGHFALTGLLIDQLLSTPGSRIVNVSSNAHYAGEIDFSDLAYQNGSRYSPQKAYSRSKLANLLFTYELQHRLESRKADVIAAAAHPGITNTALADHLFERFHVKPLRPLMGKLIQGPDMGALPSIRAAVDPAVVGGQYFGPDGPGERSGYPVVVDSNPASKDQEDARKLWEISQDLTGIRYLN